MKRLFPYITLVALLTFATFLVVAVIYRVTAEGFHSEWLLKPGDRYSFQIYDDPKQYVTVIRATNNMLWFQYDHSGIVSRSYTSLFLRDYTKEKKGKK